jgi:membrane-bound acyltransferase YfiQ involved in biofilm formation
MTPGELRRLTRFARWHLSYMALIALFFLAIYSTGSFKSTVFLKEKFIFLVIAPASTAVFVLLSPWRARWREAVAGMYERLEGQEAFCVMAGIVFLFGFLMYSVLMWGLGALLPSLFYM